MPQFEGRSEVGSFQEAIDDAVERARQSELRAEMTVSYQVTKISGARGGIAGINRMLVVIEAEVH
ncbi:MAG TPA: hypothetical protein VJX68_02155 [Candidatus Binatus sp.]|uniref:hypothetical protein n=1 Tax=Candidatus Binatus sp. TaxID=2811406 RepID=UPI002B46667D|nr:hypothetical protein [Candidatus Binatus sp.]HKN11971.1 hypothetical protein [Candidatus Binatus sp.]